MAQARIFTDRLRNLVEVTENIMQNAEDISKYYDALQSCLLSASSIEQRTMIFELAAGAIDLRYIAEEQYWNLGNLDKMTTLETKWTKGPSLFFSKPAAQKRADEAFQALEHHVNEVGLNKCSR